MLGEMIQLASGVMINKLADPDEVQKVSLRDMAVVMGILIEKGRLVDGDSTERIEVSLEDAKADLERRLFTTTAATGTEGMDRGEDG